MSPPYDSPSRLGQSPRPGTPRAAMPGPLGRVLGVVAGTILAVCALFVSVVAFAAVLVVGAVAGGWFWWGAKSCTAQQFRELGFQEGETLVVSPRKARVFLQPTA